MRVARIAPCLLLLLVILSALHLAGAVDFTIRPERASLGRALLAGLTFHINWLEGHRGYLPGGWDVLWSLSVEETFYLVFPLAAVLLGSERLFLSLLGLLVIIGPVSRTLLASADPWREYAYLSCTDAIAFGCIAALVTHHRLLGRRGSRLALLVGSLISALTIVLVNEDARTGLARFGLNVTALELGIALMVVAFGSGFGPRVDGAAAAGALPGRNVAALVCAHGRRQRRARLRHRPELLGAAQPANQIATGLQ